MFDFSGARIILGNNHVFRFNYPDQGMLFSLDFCFVNEKLGERT